MSWILFVSKLLFSLGFNFDFSYLLHCNKTDFFKILVCVFIFRTWTWNNLSWQNSLSSIRFELTTSLELTKLKADDWCKIVNRMTTAGNTEPIVRSISGKETVQILERNDNNFLTILYRNYNSIWDSCLMMLSLCHFMDFVSVILNSF